MTIKMNEHLLLITLFGHMMDIKSNKMVIFHLRMKNLLTKNKFMKN